MNRRMTRLACFLFLFTVAGSAWAGKAEEQAKALILSYARISQAPGVAVAIVKEGRLIYQDAFGLADLENNSPAQNGTRFRMASVSKVITAAAAARLYERGILDIDAPIQKYVPTFPEHEKPITVRMLAGHLGGIRHYIAKDFETDCKHYDSVKDSLGIFENDPLVNTPGTKYFYSSYGFVLISAALEAASGKSFEQVLKDEVFTPLHLQTATLDQVGGIIPFRTRFYSRESKGIMNAEFQDPSSKWAAGGILASASDLAMFGMAHMEDEYLKPETRAMLFTSQRTADGEETGVGFAWRIGKDGSGRTIYHHAGNMPGARSVILLYPDLKMAVAVLTNLYGEPAFIENTAQMIADPFIASGNVAPRSEPEGSYRMEGEFGDKLHFEGTVKFSGRGSDLHATLEGTTPMSEIAAKNKYPPAVSIPRVIVRDHALVLVFASAFGITDWKFEPSENGYSGKIEIGPLKASATLTKMTK